MKYKEKKKNVGRDWSVKSGTEAPSTDRFFIPTTFPTAALV